MALILFYVGVLTSISITYTMRYCYREPTAIFAADDILLHFLTTSQIGYVCDIVGLWNLLAKVYIQIQKIKL